MTGVSYTATATLIEILASDNNIEANYGNGSMTHYDVVEMTENGGTNVSSLTTTGPVPLDQILDITALSPLTLYNLTVQSYNGDCGTMVPSIELTYYSACSGNTLPQYRSLDTLLNRSCSFRFRGN